MFFKKSLLFFWVCLFSFSVSANLLEDLMKAIENKDFPTTKLCFFKLSQQLPEEIKQLSLQRIAFSPNHWNQWSLVNDSMEDIDIEDSHSSISLLHLLAFIPENRLSDEESEQLTLLIAFVATYIPINAHSRFGSPLHIAASIGNSEVVRFLRFLGANINELDNELRTPAHRAFEMGHNQLGQDLLESGAQEPSDYYGRTPLNYYQTRDTPNGQHLPTGCLWSLNLLYENVYPNIQPQENFIDQQDDIILQNRIDFLISTLQLIYPKNVILK